ncbi:hypothetical protein Pint_08025 [Pistacia integerrima]|uniref:Uncharacterized protein n=1 Tax=Pistacia integerrima TaxID=434235 RepID=A0ACC0XYL6_9ROSI|nr:hypothetical protein Pint_08025 [Pistacia integerrima]
MLSSSFSYSSFLLQLQPSILSCWLLLLQPTTFSVGFFSPTCVGVSSFLPQVHLLKNLLPA